MLISSLQYYLLQNYIWLSIYLAYPPTDHMCKKESHTLTRHDLGGTRGTGAALISARPTMQFVMLAACKFLAGIATFSHPSVQGTTYVHRVALGCF